MENYLQELENKIKLLLPVNTYFTLEDGEQSYNIYPTNHISLCSDLIDINIGHVIYGNLTEYETILDNLKELYTQCDLVATETGEFTAINFLSDNTYRLLLGGLKEDQGEFDFTTIKALIDYMKSLY